MSEILLCPSTMCIDFLNLTEDVKALEWGFWNPQIKKAIAFFGFGDFDYKY